MPIMTGCPYNNPVAAVDPAAPVAAGAPNLAPAQGDHVFGNVIGMIQTALQNTFGGGAAWTTRFRNYNSTAHTQWQTLAGLDLGHVHGAGQPLVGRAGPTEPDQHAHMFGGHARRFQWTFCEIVCTGFGGGGAGEYRLVGETTRRLTRQWQTDVLARYDTVVNHLVDGTALTAYLANPGQIRQAQNPPTVVHPAISLAAATAQAGGARGVAAVRITAVCGNYATARRSLVTILDRLTFAARTLDPHDDSWA